jgi:aspartyl-tRNA(Asn)/glutamyl-tRNA(Gln) amidotransferase subunit B
MNDNKQTLKETQFDAKGLIEVLDLHENKKITNKIAQNIIRELASKKFSPIAYVKENKLETVADEGALDALCKKVIGEQPKAVEDYKKGEEKSLMFLIGQVMKHTKGTASPQMVRELLITLLK